MSLEDCNSIIFYDTETLTRFYNCLDKLIIKAQIRGLWMISNWKLIPNSNKLQKQSLTEGYYNRQMKAHLLKLEKKMRIKQEITKNRAYLKITLHHLNQNYRLQSSLQCLLQKGFHQSKQSQLQVLYFIHFTNLWFLLTKTITCPLSSFLNCGKFRSCYIKENYFVIIKILIFII